jgi:hypothetical protein
VYQIVSPASVSKNENLQKPAKNSAGIFSRLFLLQLAIMLLLETMELL